MPRKLGVILLVLLAVILFAMLTVIFYSPVITTREAHITSEGHITHEVHITRQRRIELRHTVTHKSQFSNSKSSFIV